MAMRGKDITYCQLLHYKENASTILDL